MLNNEFSFTLTIQLQKQKHLATNYECTPLLNCSCIYIRTHHVKGTDLRKKTTGECCVLWNAEHSQEPMTVVIWNFSKKSKNVTFLITLQKKTNTFNSKRDQTLIAKLHLQQKCSYQLI